MIQRQFYKTRKERLANDADIVSALNNHPNISLALSEE